MAEQKVKLTELPTATDTVDTAQLLINQNSTDQKLAVTHFLRAKNNFSELTNVSQARANLDVPSVDEVNDKLTGFIDGANTFLAGASLASRSDFIWDEASKSWYYWKGTLPKDAPAASNPASTGGVGDNAWGEVGSDSLRDALLSNSGASLIGTSNGDTVQEKFDQLTDGTFNLKYRNYTVYNRLDEELSVASISGVDPTGVADSTAALQGFFNSLPNGSEVYFPAGTYKITGLVISNTSLKIRGAYRYAYGQSTTKIKAGSPNITLMKFTGSGCKIEGLLFEGYEASSANEFGKSTTCKGADFEPATGTLADIDSFVNDCIFWYFQTGVEGHGRNLTVTNTMFTFCRYGIDLYAVTNEQFRGHILNNNRFHSCGGTEASSNSTILGSVCIRLTTANTNTVDNYAGNITILNNVSDGGCYQFFKGPLHRGSILSNNSLFRIGGAGAVVIDIDNSATSSDSSSDLITVTNNNLGAFDLPPYQSGVQYAPDIGIRMTSVRGAIVQVAIDKVYLDAVKLVGCTEVIVHGEVKNPSSIVTQSTATLYSSINIDSNCANITIPYLLTRCTLLSIQLAAYVSTACPTTTVGILDGTANYSPTGPVLEIGSGYVTGDVTAVSARTKKTAISGLITGSNYPVGNYKIGDECKYLNPATTGYKGAVCTVAGNGASATWKNFGALV